MTISERTAWRLRVYPLVVLLTIAAAVALSAIRYDQGDPDSRLGGDYPSFYGAGAIVADGDWDELYSAERQQEEQKGLIDDEGGFLYFSYPPFVAAAYGALAALPYAASFLIHVLITALALWAAVRLLWPWLERTGLPPVAVFGIALLAYPVFRAVVGGQNTTITLLLLAGAARLESDKRPLQAGLVASLLLFKPQFGLIVLPLLVITQQRRLILGWLAGAVSLLGVSWLLMGGEWLSDWWSQARDFSDTNLAVNGANFVSAPGFLSHLGGTGWGVVGYGLGVLFGAAVALVWWHRRDNDPLVRWSLVGVAMAFVAPQTLYYDAGLLLLAATLLVRFDRERWIVVGIALSWVQAASSRLDWSPLGPVVIGLGALLIVSQLRQLQSRPAR